MLEALGNSEKNKETVVGYLLGQTYIKTLPDMAKEGERIFVPYESSALLGSMGMFREMALNLKRDLVIGPTACLCVRTDV